MIAYSCDFCTHNHARVGITEDGRFACLCGDCPSTGSVVIVDYAPNEE